MLTPVIGLSKHNFKKNNDNTFRVYGENFDDTSVTLKAKLESTNFDWDPEEFPVANSDRKKHYVVVKSKPNPKAAPAAPLAGDGDDDLIVTLVFDEGGPDDTTVTEDYTVSFFDDP